MATVLSSAAKTDTGRKREVNEDAFMVLPNQGLYLLADGMGGHASGQVASRLAVTNVTQYICEIARQPGFRFEYKTDSSLSFEGNLLSNAIQYANERVYIHSCKDRSMEGMGTTIAAIYNAPHAFILAHVGDSRIYRFRDGAITPLTRDHSLLNHLLDQGEVRPEEAGRFANKNVILRAIGLKDTVDVEVREVSRVEGDVYLLCSDGLSDLVSDHQIERAMLDAPSLNEICDRLVNMANAAGGKDNITVVCIEIEQENDVALGQSSMGASTHPRMMQAPQPVAAAQPMGPPMGAAPGPMSGPNQRPSMHPRQQPPTHIGAPIPAPSMPSGMIPAQGPQPVQPVVEEMPMDPLAQLDVRMHSVRVPKPIVHIPTPRKASVPKPVLPISGRLKPAVPEPVSTADGVEVRELNEVMDENLDATNPDLKPLHSVEGNVAKGAEEKPLPEPELLMLEPPQPVEDWEAEEEDEDDDRTMLELPIIDEHFEPMLEDSAKTTIGPPPLRIKKNKPEKVETLPAAAPSTPVAVEVQAEAASTPPSLGPKEEEESDDSIVIDHAQLGIPEPLEFSELNEEDEEIDSDEVTRRFNPFTLWKK